MKKSPPQIPLRLRHLDCALSDLVAHAVKIDIAIFFVAIYERIYIIHVRPAHTCKHLYCGQCAGKTLGIPLVAQLKILVVLLCTVAYAKLRCYVGIYVYIAS